MDRTARIVLILAFAFLISWYYLVNRIYPPKPVPLRNTNLVSNLTNTAGTNSINSNSVAAIPSISRPIKVPSGIEQTVVIENDDARYTFTSQSGGLKRVELKKYLQFVGCTDASTPTNSLATLNRNAPLPVLALLGGEEIEGDGNFLLTKTGTGLRAEKLLTNGLAILKDFQISSNYLIKASVRIENRSAQPVHLPARELVIGTATPMGQKDESLHLGFEWYNGTKTEQVAETWFANKGFLWFSGTPRSDYVAGASNVFWAAVNNQFFSIIAGSTNPANQVVAHRIDLPAPTRAELTADPHAYARPFGFQAAFLSQPAVIPANQAIEQHFEIFAGPKEYKILSRVGDDFDKVMGFSGFFGFFSKALLLSMNGLHAMGLPYALAIIGITVIIKTLFWPLTTASTRSMKRMAALQPQIKAIQAKYKEDPAKMNAKVMEFMKENKVSPLGGCLPMLLQIPVFIGFYQMLRSAIELRGAHLLWACDLSQPDTIFYIPGLNFPLNPLPLIMGATQVRQAHMTPPSPGMDPVQQKMMRYMPLMMVVFLYKFPAGLTLYWTVQNLLSILQMKLTKDQKPANASAVSPVQPASKPPRKGK